MLEPLTTDKVKYYVAAIVTALHEVAQPAPESSIYLALNMDIDLWYRLRSLLTLSKLITVSHHQITLTAKGVKLAEDCNAILADAKK